ncbi:MAG: SRPBCC family protein [Gemmatimonadota bacterium]
MSLTLNETFRINAPPDRVWDFLKNPAEVVTCLPGAELTETIDAQTYGGRVKVKVGPITAAYAGKATLTRVDDEARQMQIVAEGKESGGPGSARMTMTGSVTPLPDGTSEVSVDAAIDIAGRVMQFGRGLIESVNKQLFRQFAESVQTKLEVAQSVDVATAPSTTAQGEPASPRSPDSAASSAATASGTTAPTGSSAARAALESSPAPAWPATPATPLPSVGSPPPRASASPVTAPAPGAPIAQGKELRALPLLWKVFVSWIKGLFGGDR